MSVDDAVLDFDGFFRETHRRALAAMYLVTGNRHEAEEIVQDAYVRLFERWDRVRALEDPEGYLLRTAMNVFRDRFRRAAIAIRRGFTRTIADDELGAIEDRDEVVRMLRPLAPRQRAAVVATTILDMSADEAGRMLGMKGSTVRSLASRGRAQLKNLAKEPTP
jgi:RNA polymerase sigma-70 factor (ECF subfamily)